MPLNREREQDVSAKIKGQVSIPNENGRNRQRKGGEK